MFTLKIKFDRTGNGCFSVLFFRHYEDEELIEFRIPNGERPNTIFKEKIKNIVSYICDGDEWINPYFVVS